MAERVCPYSTGRRPRAVHSAVQRAARCESRVRDHREDGRARHRMDSGRSVAFNIKENPHLDHGYAVTSHSSQGQTAERVLVHVDTEQAGEKLVNRRLAYVAVSCGCYDAQIYTNDKSHLTEQLSREVSHRTATEPSQVQQPAAQKIEQTSAPSQGQAVAAQAQSIGR
jgi:ATP-dependent exoDNAse (exonuclease V) alpha subunit